MTQPCSSFSEVCADPPLRTQLWGMSSANRRRISIRRVFFSLRQKQWPSYAELCTVMDLLPGWMVALARRRGEVNFKVEIFKRGWIFFYRAKSGMEQPYSAMMVMLLAEGSQGKIAARGECWARFQITTGYRTWWKAIPGKKKWIKKNFFKSTYLQKRVILTHIMFQTFFL